MKLRSAWTPVLIVLAAAACSSNSRPASAPERAQQAEADNERAQDEQRKAHLQVERAREQVADAERAQREADEKAQFEARQAVEAERDEQGRASPPYGVTAPQRGTAAAEEGAEGVVFETKSSDLSSDDKAKLDSLAASLRAHRGRKVVVDGYPDEADWTDAKLARHRADAVAHYLERRGVPSDRIVTRTPDVDAYRRRPVHHGVTIAVQ